MSEGSQIWLIDVFTPFGGAQEVLKDMRENVFKGQPVHQALPAVGEESHAPGVAPVLTWPAC
jgi:cytolysin-activating lysine-acyltransferase